MVLFYVFEETEQGVVEGGPPGIELVAAGGFEGVEAPAVAAAGEDVELGFDAVVYEALVVAEAVFGVDTVVDAVEEEGRRGVFRDVAVGGVEGEGFEGFCLGGIGGLVLGGICDGWIGDCLFRGSGRGSFFILSFHQRLRRFFDPLRVEAGEFAEGTAVDQAGVGGDDGVEEDGEIGAGYGVGEVGGGHRGEVATGRHAHDADLADTPFLCMVTAVTECVLDVCERDFAVAGGHAVTDDADGVSSFREDLGGVGAFAAEHQFIVPAAGADEDHLALGGRGVGGGLVVGPVVSLCGRVVYSCRGVGPREIDDDPGAVTDGIEAPVAEPEILGGVSLVGGAGALRHLNIGFNDASIDPLAFRVKVDDKVRPEIIGILRHDGVRRRLLVLYGLDVSDFVGPGGDFMRSAAPGNHRQGRQQTDQAQKESSIETNHKTNIAKNPDPIPEPSENPVIRSLQERHCV